MCMYASVSNGPSEPGRKQTVPESARGTRCLGGHDEVCKTGNPGTHTHIQGTQSVWACCAEGTCTECVCVCATATGPLLMHLAYTPHWVQDVCMCELWSPKKMRSGLTVACQKDHEVWLMETKLLTGWPPCSRSAGLTGKRGRRPRKKEKKKNQG